MNSESNEQVVSKQAYYYALAFYVIVFGFFFYLFYEAGLFIGSMTKPDISGFSDRNPNFGMINLVLTGSLSLLGTIGLFFYEKLREFIVDVGDELTRVSWVELNTAIRSTAIVVGLALVSAALLFGADLGIAAVINRILATAAN